jgi:RNA polymerase sigma factor (sigma-70 family)
VANPKLHEDPIPSLRPRFVGRDGDQAENFDRFFMRQYRSIVGAVMYAGASAEDAEDAVIEAMALAEARFRELEAPGRWVRVVALRRHIRRRQRDRERERREQLAPQPPASLRPGDGELERLAGAVLDSLPAAQHLVMALRLGGFTASEIASMVHSSRETVRSNLRHARRAMAAGLKRGGWNV